MVLNLEDAIASHIRCQKRNKNQDIPLIWRDKTWCRSEDKENYLVTNLRTLAQEQSRNRVGLAQSVACPPLAR